MAAYLIGSGALGGFAPGQSDVDIVAVCATAPEDGPRQAVIAGLAELAMTWPLRGLELVLYPRAAVATPARRPQFAINLNVGMAAVPVSLDPADEPDHWFLLDGHPPRKRAPLTGPPPGELSGRSPRPWLLAAVRDSWLARRPRAGPPAVGAQRRRGWSFATEGVWSSKDDAGAWALARTDDPATVETALAIRHDDPARTLDPARVRAFQGRVLEAVERAPGLA